MSFRKLRPISWELSESQYERIPVCGDCILVSFRKLRPISWELSESQYERIPVCGDCILVSFRKLRPISWELSESQYQYHARESFVLWWDKFSYLICLSELVGISYVEIQLLSSHPKI